ncbi:hypothetical protein AZKH_0380 [Azoarcus sp. KH32C]|nr:hypothetical protein AZKH_0380 [Azoarcus sp. KH32C]
MKNFRKSHAFVLTALALFGYVAIAPAQLNTTANIKATKHNLSSSGTGSVKATSEDQICVFCHTPHAANTTAPSPLWNRKIGGGTADGNTYIATYSPYQSNSLDTTDATPDPVTGIKTLPQPGGASKLCLSCHDGTLALGTVGVLDGKSNPATVAGLTGTMPAGTGVTTGFTRNLGVDLRNDHPISFTFDSNLATSDGEFRSPPYTTGGTVVVGKRSSGVKPMLPLDHEGKVQCTSCHDPHLQASKFLRLNRLQKVVPAGGDFIAANDQICLGCHNKLGTTWANSAHANSTVADESYADLAADRREFPRGTKVWEAACLNCHDTHTAQGTRRLLREGVDSTVVGTDAGAYQTGSAASNPATVSAIEQTCYQCHQGTATKAVVAATGTVPDIKFEFGRTTHMPIVTSAQGGGAATEEKHNITNADFIEPPSLLGSGNHGNRHVECTDCHNPHRVIRNSKFYGTNSDANKDKRTHDLAGTNGNVASGVLRGAWGVQPVYGNMSTWPQAPASYDIKKGDPGSSTDTAKSQPYLTREYQLCFKCHSDYGGTSGGNMPTMGYPGGTASNTNGMTRYTNVAAEFAVYATDTPTSGTDQGEQTNAGTACGGGDCVPTGTAPQSSGAGGNNHRSWHPVMWPTGRDVKERTRNSSGTFDNVRYPFLSGTGTQTMYCSDCHGAYGSWTQAADSTTTTNGPDTTKVQGPHGSDRNFILKGYWDTTLTPSTTRGSNSSNGICGRCHNPGDNSGFDGSSSEASHAFDGKTVRPCMYCHIAVPHGWKNKAFLVNLSCVGPEGGQAAGCTAVGSTTYSKETIAPYYNQAVLRVNVWQASGNWTEGSCGAPSYNGKDWMSSACGF